MGDNKKLAVGIDVGGSFLKSGLVTSGGEIVLRDRRPIRKETREQFYEQLGELAGYLTENSGGAEVVGVGIGTPGFINRRHRHLEQSTNLQVINGAPEPILGGRGGDSGRGGDWLAGRAAHYHA